MRRAGGDHNAETRGAAHGVDRLLHRITTFLEVVLQGEGFLRCLLQVPPDRCVAFEPSDEFLEGSAIRPVTDLWRSVARASLTKRLFPEHNPLAALQQRNCDVEGQPGHEAVRLYPAISPSLGGFPWID